MSNGIYAFLVGPRVDGSEIVVIHFFTYYDTMVELNYVGSSTEESVLSLESLHEIEGLDDRTGGCFVFFLHFSYSHCHMTTTVGRFSVPFALPSRTRRAWSDHTFCGDHVADNISDIRARNSHDIRTRCWSAHCNHPREMFCPRDASRAHPH